QVRHGSVSALVVSEFDADHVASVVGAALGAVQRLMGVAYQMDDEKQRLAAILERRLRILDHLDELGKSLPYAIVVGTHLVEVEGCEIRFYIEIDVVPQLVVGIAPLVKRATLDLVSPHGDLHIGDRSVADQVADAVAGLAAQVRLGNAGHDAMALLPPGPYWCRRQHDEHEQSENRPLQGGTRHFAPP